MEGMCTFRSSSKKHQKKYFLNLLPVHNSYSQNVLSVCLKMFKILRNIKNKNSNYSYTGIGRLGSLTEEKKRPLVLLKLFKNSYKCFVCHAVNAVAKCCV